MILKLKGIYRVRGMANAAPEIILQVLDMHMDYHTRKRSYQLKAIKPSTFKELFNTPVQITWCEAKMLPFMEELEPQHIVSILYGKTNHPRNK